MLETDLARLPAAALAPLERLFPPRYAAVWREIATYLYVALRAQPEVAELGDDAHARIAYAQAERMRREMGGQQPYLPTGRDLELSERDREIGAAFNGRNLRELARKYDLTDVRIRQIHAVWLAEQIAQRQGRLPLETS